MIEVGNLDANLNSYFELSLIIIEVTNLYTNLECCIELSFIMVERWLI